MTLIRERYRQWRLDRQARRQIKHFEAFVAADTALSEGIRKNIRDLLEHAEQLAQGDINLKLQLLEVVEAYIAEAQELRNQLQEELRDKQ